MNEPKKFLLLPDVIAMVGIKRTMIYERTKAGSFPPPVQIAARAVVWNKQKVAKWQHNLARGVKKKAV